MTTSGHFPSPLGIYRNVPAWLRSRGDGRPHVEVGGLAATRLLAGPGVEDPIPVIVVTTFDLDEYVFEALQAGASGFLLKESIPEELLPAIAPSIPATP